MDDSTAMTIEFLRARLLSERNVSRTARQRADELARRVLELEEQLKIVQLQRLRAEKATADVLTILESHGATDVSEAYDSSSDQEETPCGSEVDRSSFKEEQISANGKLSSRSLSWKSGKDSAHSRETKYSSSSRRRRSSIMSSTSSSPKHIGKSCRRIRCRETRSAAKDSQNDSSKLPLQGDEIAKCSSVPTCSDSSPETLKEGLGNHEEQFLGNGPALRDLATEIGTDGHYFNGPGEDGDMKKALEHQAQLIGRYEAEEKAQRDWEEKFRENNSHTPDSCDLGNRSDGTEERDDNREPAPALQSPTVACNNQQETKLKEAGISFNGESSTPNGFPSSLQFDTGFLDNQESSRDRTYKPPASEPAFSKSKRSQDEEYADAKPEYAGANLQPHIIPYGANGDHGVHVSSSNGSSLLKDASESTNELPLMPHEPSNELGSVLEALQQAKLSLKKNLSRSPIVESGPVRRAIDSSVPFARMGDQFMFPVGSAGLFRLPTDFQFEATSGGNILTSDSQLGLTNYSLGHVADRFSSSPYMESRLGTSFGDRFYTSHAYPYMETRSGMPTRFPILTPTLESSLTTSSGFSSPDPHRSPGLPSASRYAYPSYPFYPDMMQRVPSGEGISRALSSKEVQLPPTAHFPYNGDHTRPPMYR